jgi:hypothetical protein
VLALAAAYQRNGCCRVPNPKRRQLENQAYKKGYEVRFSAGSDAELRRLRAMLRAVGFKPGKPYRKARRFIQPIYGRAAVEGLLS